MKKLPPSLLMALGLTGCGPSVVVVESSGTSTASEGSADGPMTSPTSPTGASNSGPSGSGSGSGSDTGSGSESESESDSTSSPTDPTIPGTGCLSPPWTSSSSTTDDINFIEPETSACLEPPTTSFTTGFTTTSGDSGSTTGEPTESSSDSGGGADPNADRGRILQRLHDSGVLPPDLLEQLERRRR